MPDPGGDEVQRPARVVTVSGAGWHVRWGATAAEVAGSMPGDRMQPKAQFKATRAITIDAPPEAVWPWLVQVGCGRAGFYSNDLLDNLARPSATTVIPEFQHLRTGKWVPMSPSATPNNTTAMKVQSFEVDKWLLWSNPDSTWAWQLTRTNGNGGPAHGTRLVPLPRTLALLVDTPGGFLA